MATRAWSWTRSSIVLPGVELEAAGVDHHEAPPVPVGLAVDPVAGRARRILDDRGALADHPVEERALPDVRATDDGDHGQRGHGRSVSARSGSARIRTLVRIGMVATRLAGVDGVTFETAKWEAVLGRMGHEVRLCAGEVDALRSTARLVPAMHFTRSARRPSDGRRL